VKYAAIVPSNAQGRQLIKRTNHAYHLVLAHELLAHSTMMDFYHDLSRQGHTIIVDNGVAEGSDISFNQVVEVATYLEASEIIMPDTITGPWQESVNLTTDSIAQLMVPANKRAIVPHGKTWIEWRACIAEIAKQMQFATIAISRGCVKFDPQGGRLRALRELEQMGYLRTHNIHLLGAVEYPKMELSTVNLFYGRSVRSIDTAAPVGYAQNGAKMDSPQRHSIDWNVDRSFNFSLGIDNFVQFRAWCSEVHLR
jgi:hypothetical protein